MSSTIAESVLEKLRRIVFLRTDWKNVTMLSLCVKPLIEFFGVGPPITTQEGVLEFFYSLLLTKISIFH